MLKMLVANSVILYIFLKDAHIKSREREDVLCEHKC